jgi:hypothetical protein
MRNRRLRAALGWSAGAVAAAAAAYAGYVVTTWVRYGQPARPDGDAQDPLLDRFMPVYDIAERHHIRVAAPGHITIEAAREMDLNRSRVSRAIFRTREAVLGAARETAEHPRGIIAWTQSLGCGVLAEVPGREIVMGAVTQPWQANVSFTALPPDEFATFDAPDAVKIVWTLRADPVGEAASVFRTETRAVATDAEARRKFRRYWSLLSPGIIMIRWMALAPLKADAEARFRATGQR